MSWTLLDPWALALLPAPLLLPAARAAAAGAMTLPPSLAARMTDSVAATLRARRWAGWLCWLCLVLACAGPARLTQAQAAPSAARDILFVLDLSGSMATEDFELDGEAASRLAVVKRFGAALMRGRAGDRVGIIGFGDDAYAIAPMTYDVEAAAQALLSAEIGLSGRGTAIGAGIGLALKRLKRDSEAQGVLVLLSDGAETAGAVSGAAAAALAAEMGARLHSIALGPLTRGEAGAGGLSVDAPALEALAQAAGGVAFRARDVSELDAVLAELDRLEPRPGPPPAALSRQDYWVWPAGLGFVAALAGWGRR